MATYADFVQRKLNEWKHELGKAFLDPKDEDDWDKLMRQKHEEGEACLDPDDASYHEDDEEMLFLDSGEKALWHEFMREQKANQMALELQLLKGAISFEALPPQQQLEDPASRPVLTTYLTKDGCIDHSLVSACAVDELSALALDKDGRFWTNDGLLNRPLYQQTFPWPKSPICTPYDDANSSWTHASRASAIVKMEHTRLAKKFTLDNWDDLFPSIVSNSIGLRFLSPGSSSRNPDGSMQLIQIQLQATTRLVPQMNFVVLRTCKQIDHLTWVVADVSVDSSLNVGYPCGCLIQGVDDGSSKVTWVEHLEFEESYLDPKLYNDLCGRGFAFGAERWVACLERSCERRSYHQTKSYFYGPPLVGQEDPCEWEKRCVMRLSKRMVRQFCLNIGPFGWRQNPPSSCVPASRQSRLILKINRSPYHDDPRELVFLATSTFSVPHSPEFVLKILGDERRRHKLDASGRIGPLTEVACYTTGADPRNKISVQANKSFGDDQLLLQETSVSRSGSLVVWSLLKTEPSFDLSKLGQKPESCPLIGLSGIAISSNSHQNTASSSSNTGGGSYVTLGLQHEARRIEGSWPKLDKAIAKCMRDTILRIEEALNNPKGEGDHGSTNKRKCETGDCLY